MSDAHIRALRDSVRQRVRTLKAHRARAGETNALASARLDDLERLSARDRARLAAAEAKRRSAPDGA
jgi:hypothetical protein